MKYTHTRARSIRNVTLKKIKTQFPDIPEAMLCFAVIENAVNDLTADKEKYRRSAKEYLTQSVIPHADICGIESSWIQRVLRKCQII